MRTKPVFRKILFITIPGLFIFLIVLEICLRIGGYLYIQHRDPRLYVKKTESVKEEFKLLCLGDSFTFGVGAVSESSYPRQLEKILQENVSKDISVINGGRLANTSSLLLKNIQGDIDKYSPDAMLIMIGCNNNWNLEDSSYFLLNRDDLSIIERLDRMLSGLRVYKLIKISRINFINKIKVNTGDKKSIDNKIIVPESQELFILAMKLFYQGYYSQAVEKLEEALVIDKNNYRAHLLLGYIWNSYKKYQLAREEMWKCIYLVDEWDANILGNITCQIMQFDDAVINRESELVKLKKYLQDKHVGEKRDRLGKIVDANLRALKNQDIYCEILEYDLKEIIRIAEENKIKVILETYPHRMFSYNTVIREISKKYGFLLVDNSEMFEEKQMHYDTKDFFIPDGHCNENGYKFIAEATYDALVKRGVLPRKKIGENINDR